MQEIIANEISFGVPKDKEEEQVNVCPLINSAQLKRCRRKHIGRQVKERRNHGCKPATERVPRKLHVFPAVLRNGISYDLDCIVELGRPISYS